MAIYHHVAGKQALLSGISALVFQDLQLPDVQAFPWQAQVRAFAHAYHALVRAHPNLVLYLVTDAEAAARVALAANELLYGALARAGLAPNTIVRAADVVVDYLNGFALGERSERLGQPGERQALVSALGQQPAQSFPTMHSVLTNVPDQELCADLDDG